MKIGYRVVLLSGVMFSCVGCDQATKQIALSTLDASARTYYGGILRLQLSFNPGAFLSMGDSLPASVRQSLFLWGVGLFLLAGLVLSLSLKRVSTLQFVGLGLCLAGGVSNLIDRIRFNGAVVDFLNVGIENLRTGIFNVADMLILAGAAILAVCFLRGTGAQQQGER